MLDTSVLETLYSALIQGGATILAVFGGFLLTLAPIQRSVAARIVRDLSHAEDIDADVKQAIADMEATITTLERDAVLGQFLPTSIDPKDLQTRLRAVQRKREAAEEANRSLGVVALNAKALIEDQINRAHAQRNAGNALLFVAFFCVLSPALALAWLVTDTHAGTRSFFVVLGYSAAIVFVASLVLRAGLPTDDAKENASVARSRHFVWHDHVVFALMGIALLGTVLPGSIPLPRTVPFNSLNDTSTHRPPLQLPRAPNRPR